MIDSHCHLCDEKYDGEIENIIENFKRNGVQKVLNVSASIEDCILTNKLSNCYDNVYYSIGIHPENIENYDEKEFEFCLRLALGLEINESLTKEFKHNFDDVKPVFDSIGKNKLLAIGEIGLDYYWRKDNKEEQIKVFESQIKLAKKYNLPFIVHNRDASGDVLAVIKRNAPYERTNIIHCFSASEEFAREVFKLGFAISFSGSVTFKNARNLQEVAKNVLEDKFLIETDSPYLAPEPYRGQRNEPALVIEVANKIATLKGLPVDYIDKCTTENFNRIFNL